jgi:hypothetical protein
MITPAPYSFKCPLCGHQVKRGDPCVDGIVCLKELPVRKLKRINKEK